MWQVWQAGVCRSRRGVFLTTAPNSQICMQVPADCIAGEDMHGKGGLQIPRLHAHAVLNACWEPTPVNRAMATNGKSPILRTTYSPTTCLLRNTCLNKISFLCEYHLAFCSSLQTEQLGMFYLESAYNPIMLYFLCTERLLFNGAALIVLEIDSYLERGGVCVSWLYWPASPIFSGSPPSHLYR